MKPHKHAELIKQWADGAEIEHWCDGIWEVTDPPMWRESEQYRIKDPYAELKAAAADPTKQIRVNSPSHVGEWEDADVFNWYLKPEEYEIRDKPKPKKQVKLLAWFDGIAIAWRSEGYTMGNECQRVPSEDKVIEVEA